MKHTLGPWRLTDLCVAHIDGEENILTCVESEGWGTIAYVDSTPIGDKEIEANALLIAAAPALLEALEGMLAEFGNQRFEVRRDFSKMVQIEAARKALAKAKGA